MKQFWIFLGILTTCYTLDYIIGFEHTLYTVLSLISTELILKKTTDDKF